MGGRLAGGGSISRRGFVALAAASGARPCLAGDPAGAADPFQRLLAGNERFVARRLTSLDEDLDILRAGTVARQAPFVAVLSCADSRVPVELVFDQSIGHIFACRVAGNVCTPEVIGSLEYAVAVLDISAILVLGHTGCGAVQAALTAKPVPGQISALFAPIAPGLAAHRGSLDDAVRANALAQADVLRRASTVITPAGAVVRAAVYDLSSGRVRMVDG